MLACLVLQPFAVALGGPSLARVVDSVFQLVLVGLMIVLARATLGIADAFAALVDGFGSPAPLNA